MSDIDNTQAIMRKLEPMLRELSRRELVVLNKMVVERIRLMIKAESLLFMTKFSVGDRVSWTGNDGRHHTGIIIRLNNKTASVQIDNEGYWKVSPQLLRKA
jgi:plastocyanin